MAERTFYDLDVNRAWPQRNVFYDLQEAGWRVSEALGRTQFNGPLYVTHPAWLERVELTVYATETPEAWSSIRERLTREGLRPAVLREGATFAILRKRDCLAAGSLLVAGEVLGLAQRDPGRPHLPTVAVPVFGAKRKPRCVLAPFDTARVAAGAKLLCAKA